MFRNYDSSDSSLTDSSSDSDDSVYDLSTDDSIYNSDDSSDDDHFVNIYYCMICNKLFDKTHEILKLSCNHYAHHNCYNTYIINNSNCTLCYKQIKNMIHEITCLNDLIKNI